jgi:hypothetical protein
MGDSSQTAASTGESNNMTKIFERVAERRGYEVSTLEDVSVQFLLREINALTGRHLKAKDPKDAGNQIRALLFHCYQTICNPKASSQQQRRSWDILNDVFHMIDVQMEGKDPDAQLNGKNGVSMEEQRRKQRRLSAQKVAALARAELQTPLVLLDDKGKDEASRELAVTTTEAMSASGKSTTVSSQEATGTFPSTTATPNVSNGKNSSTASTAPMPAITARTNANDHLPSLSRNPTALAIQPAPSQASAISSKSSSNDTMEKENRKRSRSVASLSEASASTSRIAHDSTLLPASKPSSSNGATRSTSPLPNSPAPQYQKRSSNALAHEELQLQHLRKKQAVSTTTTQQPRNGLANPSGNHPGPNTVAGAAALQRQNGKNTASTFVAAAAAPAARTHINGDSAGTQTSRPSDPLSLTSVLAATVMTNSTAPRLPSSKPTNAPSSTTTAVVAAQKKKSPTATMPHGASSLSGPCAADSMDISDTDNEGTATPTVSKHMTKTNFAVDVVVPSTKLTKFSCYVKSRPFVGVNYYKQSLSGTLMEKVGNRLAKWEPFWETQKILATGLTVPVANRNYFNVRKADVPPEPTPNTVASFDMSFFLPSVAEFINLNVLPTNGNAKPKEGEYRVLFRMVPVKPSEEQKKKRADCHIWPKGTFLVVKAPSGGFPQLLEQKKQQSWDTKYWQGLSKHLDLTPAIKHLLKPTRSNKLGIELCCHDDQQYYYSVAVCKYVSPSSLYTRLMAPSNPYMVRLSLDASYGKAVAMMQNNEVSLDSDDEGDQDAARGALKRITFSMKDPVSKTKISTPVRGRKCRHFSVSFEVV